MTSDQLPSVLVPKNPAHSSISMERALKQIKHHLESYPLQEDAAKENSIWASIDDVDVMLAAINRGD